MANFEKITEELLKEKAVLLKQMEIFQNEQLGADLMEDAARTRKPMKVLLSLERNWMT